MFIELTRVCWPDIRNQFAERSWDIFNALLDATPPLNGELTWIFGYFSYVLASQKIVMLTKDTSMQMVKWDFTTRSPKYCLRCQVKQFFQRTFPSAVKKREVFLFHHSDIVTFCVQLGTIVMSLDVMKEMSSTMLVLRRLHGSTMLQRSGLSWKANSCPWELMLKESACPAHLSV